MSKELVSFETAKEIKKQGFNEVTEKFYVIEQGVSWVESCGYGFTNAMFTYNRYSAPTVEQYERWKMEQEGKAMSEDHAEHVRKVLKTGYGNY